eukprot:SAG31_NODE_70_length_28117_cov_100.521843_14_plen_88_part_00
MTEPDSEASLFTGPDAATTTETREETQKRLERRLWEKQMLDRRGQVHSHRLKSSCWVLNLVINTGTDRRAPTSRHEHMCYDRRALMT